jgi:hypothetical protein
MVTTNLGNFLLVIIYYQLSVNSSSIHSFYSVELALVFHAFFQPALIFSHQQPFLISFAAISHHQKKSLLLPTVFNSILDNKQRTIVWNVWKSAQWSLLLPMMRSY